MQKVEVTCELSASLFSYIAFKLSLTGIVPTKAVTVCGHKKPTYYVWRQNLLC